MAKKMNRQGQETIIRSWNRHMIENGGNWEVIFLMTKSLMDRKVNLSL